MSKIILTARPLNLRLKYPFGISRSSSPIAKNVLVTVHFDDLIGYGEAAPSAFYGEDQNSVIDFVKSFGRNRCMDEYLTNIQKLKSDLDNFTLSFSNNLSSSLFSYSARASIEMAFWDLIGKVQKKPLFEFFFTSNPFCKSNDKHEIPPTSYTIGLDSLSIVEEKIRYALNKGFTILKIKLGKNVDDDIVILRAVKKLTSDTRCKLRLDVNGGWDFETAKKMIDIISEFNNIEILEQPLPKGKIQKHASLVPISKVPIILDEDCVSIQDIEKLAGKVNGVNIKLMKAGSLIEAFEMTKLAKSYNLKVMIGCMVESSCAISAAVHLSPLVDYVDLDGHLLLEKDPFFGLILEENRVLPSLNDGLGVELAIV